MRRRPSVGRDLNAIDPASGFKVKLSDLVRQWDGERVDRRFVDKRNPQDFVRAVKEAIPPFTRPETPDIGLALPILTEPFGLIMTEGGQTIYMEGLTVTL